MSKPILWIVIPCYNEEQVLPITAPLFLKKINDLSAAGLVSEKSRVLFVNDGSRDATWSLIQKFASEDEHFIGISQSRNRGHQNAVLAGLMEALQRGATGRRFYSKDYAAYINRGRIIVVPVAGEDPCETELTATAHKVYCGNSVILARHTDIDNIESLRQPENVALLDADLLQWPLKLRRWHEGDAFVPFGMNGRKKVSDFLINEKVSLPEKNRQFVLVSGDDIVWVVGRRIDDRYRVSDRTENILLLRREII